MRSWLVILLLTACKTSDSSNVTNQTPEQQIDHDQAYRELNDFAAKLFQSAPEHQQRLNELFREAKAQNDEPLVTAYRVALGPVDTCFNTAELKIQTAARRDALRQQLTYIATFLREFHYELLGKNRGMFSFRRVEICPKPALKADMLVDLYVLKVGIPFDGSKYTPLDNSMLRDFWNKGYPIGIAPEPTGFLASIKASRDKARGIGLTFWKLFNPLSPVRKGLRKLTHELGIDLYQRVGQVLARFQPPAKVRTDTSIDDQTKQQRLAEIRNNYLAELDAIMSSGEVTNNKLQNARLVDALKADQSGDKLRLFFESLHCFLQSSSTRAGFEDQSLAIVQSALGDSETDIETEVKAGLVAVGNHHTVNVNLAVAGVQNFSKYFEQPNTRKMKIRLKVSGGLVAVGTSDDIDVQVDFNFVKGARTTGAVDSALFASANQLADSCSTLLKHD
jgi:hypothetical protein